MEWIPVNSKQLLDEMVCADSQTKVLSERFEHASTKEIEELRGIVKELSEKGYIDVKWADNVLYFVIINNSGRTYNEQFTHYEEFYKKARCNR